MLYTKHSALSASFGFALAFALAIMFCTIPGLSSAQADEGTQYSTSAKVRAQMAARKAELYMTRHGLLEQRSVRMNSIKTKKMLRAPDNKAVKS